MKKIINIDFFSDSKKWPRRIPKIKKITLEVIKIMKLYFKKNHFFSLNLIFSDKKRLSQLNRKYKNIYKDTDVLTFISKTPNKELGKILYCDIFFSIDTIEKFIKKNNITIYEHFSHLLIHSLLHINGFDHKNISQYNKMKKQEIKVLKKIGIGDPYN